MAKRKEKGRSSTPIVITALVMVLLFCLFVIFLVSQGQSIPDVDEVKAQTRLKNLADLNLENQKILTQYRWIDKSKGVVGIPIDRAMDLVLVQLQSTQPHPAGPVNPPAAPQASPTQSPNQASPAPSPNK
jgi:Ca2+/Na+ antiporter